MRARRVWATLAAIAMALATVGCGDDGSDGGTDDPAGVTDDGGTDDAPGGDDVDGDGDGGDGGASGSAAAACDDIPRSTLDLVAPGLEPEEIESLGDLAALACGWDSERLFLQLMRWDGTQFWPEPLYENEETTDVDLCDRAFVSADFGLDLHVLDGDQVWTVGATQAGVPQEERLSVDEGIDRLVAFAEAVIAC